MRAVREISASVPERPPAEQSNSRHGRFVGFVIAGLTLAVGLGLADLAANANRTADELFAVWATSSFGLLTVWYGLSNVPRYVRFPAVIIPCLLVALTRSASFDRAIDYVWIVLLAAGLPFFILRSLGFKLHVVNDGDQADRTRARIGLSILRRLFRPRFGMTMLIGSLWVMMVVSKAELLLVGVSAFFFALVVSAISCAILLPGGRQTVGLRALAAFALADFISVGVPLLLYGSNEYVLRHHSIPELYVLCAVFVVSAVLLVYRRLNYRLLCRAVQL